MVAISKVVCMAGCYVLLCLSAFGVEYRVGSELRRPTSVCWNETTERLLVGNQDGTIAVIDTASDELLADHELGE